MPRMNCRRDGAGYYCSYWVRPKSRSRSRKKRKTAKRKTYRKKSRSRSRKRSSSRRGGYGYRASGPRMNAAGWRPMQRRTCYRKAKGVRGLSIAKLEAYARRHKLKGWQSLSDNSLRDWVLNHSIAYGHGI